jgi:2-polyprenyl-3-methyl-5-hydroxy-6-metoxy-1,4-benzoquinol methylase
VIALPAFGVRSDEPELMDDPSIPAEELERTLADIEHLNRAFRGYAPSVDGFASLIEPERRSVTVLDVGIGGADHPKRLVEWGRKRGIDVDVLGIDLTEATIDYARRRAEGWPIRVAVEDLFDLDPGRRFDVVHAAQALHHFPGDSAARAIAHMHRHARLGVVINDLHRHAAAWAGIGLYTRVAVRSRLVRYDAPLSVLRGFSRSELVDLCRQAEVPAPQIRWRALFRWQMVIKGEDEGGLRAG